MSHFVVIVVGENPEDQLAPYHEFECTGKVDQYVESVDQTEEVRKEYAEHTRAMVRAPNGEVVSAYDDQFYRDPTPEETAKIGPIAGSGGGRGMSWSSRDWGDGRGYRTKIHDLQGAEEVQVATNEVMTFREFVDYQYEREVLDPGQEPDLHGVHKFGWVEVDAAGEVVKVIDRTNPRRKWDWYELGGRWHGYFPLKRVGASAAVDLTRFTNMEGGTQPTDRALLGRPGVFKNEPKANTCDQCCWGYVDIERARNEAGQAAREHFAEWRASFEKYERPVSWAEVHEKMFPGDIDKARSFYNGQPAIKSFKKNSIFGCPVKDIGFDEEAHVERARKLALVPFAILKDGKWHERGEMGWWGTVRDEKNPDSWEQQVQALFDDLAPETLVSAYDCHI